VKDGGDKTEAKGDKRKRKAKNGSERRKTESKGGGDLRLY